MTAIADIAGWVGRLALLGRALSLLARAPRTPGEKAGRLLLDAGATAVMLGIEVGRMM
jgi:hypothetical protein